MKMTSSHANSLAEAQQCCTLLELLMDEQDRLLQISVVAIGGRASEGPMHSTYLFTANADWFRSFHVPATRFFN